MSGGSVPEPSPLCPVPQPPRGPGTARCPGACATRARAGHSPAVRRLLQGAAYEPQRARRGWRLAPGRAGRGRGPGAGGSRSWRYCRRAGSCPRRPARRRRRGRYPGQGPFGGLGEHRVEHRAGVVHRHVPDVAHLTGLHVDLDHGHVRAERERGAVALELHAGHQPVPLGLRRDLRPAQTGLRVTPAQPSAQAAGRPWPPGAPAKPFAQQIVVIKQLFGAMLGRRAEIG